MNTPEKQKREGLRRNEQKWTAPLMDAGWTAVPTVLLERQQALGLDSLDLNILLQLARYWWFADNLPKPAKGTLAENIGVDPSTVRRRIARLEAGGLIRRRARFGSKDHRQEANEYDFAGLIKHATPYANEILATRETRKAEDNARRKRKRPAIHLVKTGGDRRP